VIINRHNFSAEQAAKPSKKVFSKEILMKNKLWQLTTDEDATNIKEWVAIHSQKFEYFY
jgi:hypothetical protein